MVLSIPVPLAYGWNISWAELRSLDKVDTGSLMLQIGVVRPSSSLERARLVLGYLPISLPGNYNWEWFSECCDLLTVPETEIVQLLHTTLWSSGKPVSVQWQHFDSGPVIVVVDNLDN